MDGSVRIEGADRAGRERRLRYCARPPFALERLREIDGEHLLYESTKPGPGGNGPLLLTPLKLLDGLASLRIHRHRYFGERPHMRNVHGDPEGQELAGCRRTDQYCRS